VNVCARVASVPSIPALEAHRISVAEVGVQNYVLTASGVLGSDAARDLKDALYPLAAAAEAAVVVDLAAATIVDPATVGVVEGAATLLAARGGELVVVTRDPRVRTQLVIGGSSARVEAALAGAFEGVR
jgi:anti-anti-sigma factor